MIAARHVKIAQRNGRHMVYWFVVETSGRTYGGQIIGTFTDFGVAMKKAQTVSPDGAVIF